MVESGWVVDADLFSLGSAQKAGGSILHSCHLRDGSFLIWTGFSLLLNGFVF